MTSAAEFLCAAPGCNKPWNDPVHSHRFLVNCVEPEEEEELTVAVAIRMRVPKGLPTTAATQVALERVHGMQGYLSAHAEVLGRHEARKPIPYPMMRSALSPEADV